MIRRALHGDVERDLQAMSLAGVDQRAKVVQRAELRLDCRVAAVLRSDRVKASRIARPGLQGVVATLAVGDSDRMDRGEVEDIEAHCGDVWQSRDAIAERAVLSGNGALAARDHLVPGAVNGPLAIDHQRKEPRPRQVRPLLARGQRGRELCAQEQFDLAGLQIRIELPTDERCRLLIGADRLRQQCRSLERIEADILAGLLFQLEAVPPARKCVGPGFDGIFVPAGFGRREASNPAVVLERLHRRAPPG